MVKMVVIVIDKRLNEEDKVSLGGFNSHRLLDVMISLLVVGMTLIFMAFI